MKEAINKENQKEKVCTSGKAELVIQENSRMD